jgi:hypothetical protein
VKGAVGGSAVTVILMSMGCRPRDRTEECPARGGAIFVVLERSGPRAGW